MRLEFRPAAALDLERSATWYERQKTGLGSQFLSEVDLLEGRVADNPYQFPIVFRGARRALMPRFPFALYFHVQDDLALVVAVVDQRQKPSRWRRRV